MLVVPFRQAVIQRTTHLAKVANVYDQLLTTGRTIWNEWCFVKLGAVGRAEPSARPTH